MERIISFLPDQVPDPDLFSIEVTGITYPDPNYHIDRNHSFIYCLEYVIAGEGTVQINGSVYRPRKGDVYLLPAGADHHYFSSSSDPWEKIWFNVSGSLCDTLIKGYGLDSVIIFHNCNAYSLFRSFLSSCEQKDANYQEIFHKAALIFHEITTFLHSHVQHCNAEPLPNPTASELKNFIDRNIYQHFSMKLLEETVNMSASQITRLFKKVYGQTPYDYILTQKIATAKLLLRTTSMPIKEIAYRLSFADEHYFSNVYKDRTGIPPSDEREGRR